MKHSAAYRVWHSFLCACGALILLANIAGTASLRYYMRTDAPVQGLADSRLSDAKIPFTGKTVAGLVRQELVPDEVITEEDVAAAVDSMEIPQYIASKLGAHLAMLRGDVDTHEEITTGEIATLLERNRTTLYQKCLLVIEDSDIQQLKDTIQKPVEALNSYGNWAYASKAGRMIARFRASWYHILLDILLLGLLAWRWVKVRTNSGAAGTVAVKKLGRLTLIPSVGVFLWVAISELASLFVRDGVVGLHPLTHALRIPHWGISAAMAAAGVLLIFGTRFFEIQMARYIQKHAVDPNQPAKVPEKKQEQITDRQNTPEQSRIPFESSAFDTANTPEAPIQTAAPAIEPAIQAEPDPLFPEPAPVQTAAPAQTEKLCISCGKPLKTSAIYCIYCGTNQKTGSNAVDEILSETAAAPKPAHKLDLSKNLSDTAPLDLSKPENPEG